MFKEAGLRSPRTQLTKFQIAISVQGRRTEAICTQIDIEVDISNPYALKK